MLCARHCDWHDCVSCSQHPCEVDLITSILLKLETVLIVYQRRQDLGLDLCEFIHEVNEYVLKTSCVPDLVLGYEGKVVNKVDWHISFWNMIEKHETDSHILILFQVNPAK